MIPSWLQAIVLGVVQGLTEFLPVSSSGHLVLVPYLLGWESPGLAFVAGLHLGTLVALLAYFRRDLLVITTAVLSRSQTAEARGHRWLALAVVIGTLPVAAAGLLLREQLEEAFESPPAAATALLVTAAVLAGSEWVRRRRVRAAHRQAEDPATLDAHAPVWSGDWVTSAHVPEIPTAVAGSGPDADDPTGRSLAALRLRDAIVVGIGQAIALLPGLSRSGTTIGAGLVGGLNRVAAARFAFLLGIPAFAGAVAISLGDLTATGPYSDLDVVLGIAVSAVTGYLAIGWLLRLVARAGLGIFVRYLIAASALSWLGYWMLGPPGSA